MYNMSKQSEIYLQEIQVKKRHRSGNDSIDTKVGYVNTQQTSNGVDKLKESFLRFYLMSPLYCNNSLK